MSSKIVKFTVPVKTAKLLKRVLLTCICLGLLSLVLAIAMGSKPTPESTSFSLSYSSRKVVEVNAEAGQIVYISVEENGGDKVWGYLYDEYNWQEEMAGRYGSDIDQFGDYYEGYEISYNVKESGKYYIVVENWESDEYRSGMLFYSVYNKRTGLITLFSIGTVVFPVLGMMIYVGGAAIADSKYNR